VIGIKFSLKSPAVGSTNRQFPEASLSATDENAFTAVPSTGLASAAAEGSRTPPARDTALEVVAVPVVAVDAGAAVVRADEEDTATGLTELVGNEAASADTVCAFPVPVPEFPDDAPKVNVWVASEALQGAWSSTLPDVTVRHVPAAFSGDRVNGPAVPLKGNN
jgi:hypothetical protein